MISSLDGSSGRSTAGAVAHVGDGRRPGSAQVVGVARCRGGACARQGSENAIDSGGRGGTQVLKRATEEERAAKRLEKKEKGRRAAQQWSEKHMAPFWP